MKCVTFAKLVKQQKCKCVSPFVNTIFILAKSSIVWEGDHKFGKIFFSSEGDIKCATVVSTWRTSKSLHCYHIQISSTE